MKATRMGSVQAEAFESWDGLAQQARGLLAGENHRIANAANLAALIFNSVPDLNWAGFYFVENGELVVGPFQRRAADPFARCNAHAGRLAKGSAARRWSAARRS